MRHKKQNARHVDGMARTNGSNSNTTSPCPHYTPNIKNLQCRHVVGRVIVRFCAWAADVLGRIASGGVTL